MKHIKVKAHPENNDYYKIYNHIADCMYDYASMRQFVTFDNAREALFNDYPEGTDKSLNLLSVSENAELAKKYFGQRCEVHVHRRERVSLV